MNPFVAWKIVDLFGKEHIHPSSLSELFFALIKADHWSSVFDLAGSVIGLEELLLKEENSVVLEKIVGKRMLPKSLGKKQNRFLRSVFNSEKVRNVALEPRIIEPQEIVPCILAVDIVKRVDALLNEATGLSIGC